MTSKELINSEMAEMKQHLLLFDPDPESKLGYFTIYKGIGTNEKVIGRSNREFALDRFLLNVKLAPEEEVKDLYVVFDSETITKEDGEVVKTYHNITKPGRVVNGYDSYSSNILMLLMTDKEII